MLSYPHIDPIALHAFGHPLVHWYGVMYLLAFVTAFLLVKYRLPRYHNWNSDKLSDLLFYGVLGVILGGRIGYMVFYQFDFLLHNPLALFKIWQGGLSFHGGFLGVVVAMVVFCRKYQHHPFMVLDLIAPAVPLGLMYGRFGNFINGELYGRVTDATFPLAMVFPTDPFALPRHPSQLYQAFGEGLLLFIVLWWFSRSPRPRYAVSGVFLLGYGFARFMAEFVRQPDADQGFIWLGWMTKGQLLTVPMLLAGVCLLLYAYRSNVYDWTRPASTTTL